MTLLTPGSNYVRPMTVLNLHRAVAILIALALGFSGNISKADQNDPRLPKLFESLKSATDAKTAQNTACLLYTSPSPRDAHESRMPSSA